MMSAILLISSIFWNIGCISNNTQKEKDSSLSRDSANTLLKNTLPREAFNDELEDENEKIQESNPVVYSEEKEVIVKAQGDNLVKYANINRLGASAQKRFLNKGFSGYNLITSSTIDRNGDEKFDEDAIITYLDKFYKDENSEGLLVINWEKVKFFDLKEIASSKKFKTAEQEFIRLLKFIKSKRPKLTVGIYGLPFRVFNNKYPRYGEKNKFLNILRECDVICPSLYVKFSDEDIGADKTDFYMKNNLEVATDYSKQLNIPVLPFVWEIIQDNKADKRLMPLSQFRRQMEIIMSFNSSKTSNSGVHGIIWWTPSNPVEFYRNIAPAQQGKTDATVFSAKSTQTEKETRDRILIDYIDKTF